MKLIDDAVAQLKSLYGNNIKFSDDKKNKMNGAAINATGVVESCSIMIIIDWGKNVAYVKAFNTGKMRRYFSTTYRARQP